MLSIPVIRQAKLYPKNGMAELSGFGVFGICREELQIWGVRGIIFR
jgi:hypothetical protein